MHLFVCMGKRLVVENEIRMLGMCHSRQRLSENVSRILSSSNMVDTQLIVTNSPKNYGEISAHVCLVVVQVAPFESFDQTLAVCPHVHLFLRNKKRGSNGKVVGQTTNEFGNCLEFSMHC